MGSPRHTGLRIGVIGLGRMGRSLATSLLAEGFPVSCYDIASDAVAATVAAGATAATSPRELAERSDVVATFLPGPAEVAEVALNRERGVLAGLRPDAIMIDMSTCGPDTAAELGQAFDRSQRRFVDCPVSRRAPDMTVLVGGEPGVLGAAEDALRRVSRNVVHCGFRGAGYATKLLNQHIKYAWYLASAEALMLAQRYGLDPDLAASAVEQCSGGESGLSTAAKYFRGDSAGMSTHAPASTIEKDAVLAEAMAANAGVRSRTLDAVVDFFVTVGATPYRDLPYPQSCEFLAGLRMRGDGREKNKSR